MYNWVMYYDANAYTLFAILYVIITIPLYRNHPFPSED